MLIALLWLVGCGPDATVSLQGGRVRFTDGRIDVYDDDRLVLGGARAVVTIDGATVDTVGGRAGLVLAIRDVRGDGEQLVSWVGPLTWTVTAYDDGLVTARVDVRPARDAVVEKVLALEASSAWGGGLWLGADPARHRILENGQYGVLDFLARNVPGDVARSEGYAALAPGAWEGHSVSTWNHAVQDLDGRHGWVAGALTFFHATPMAELSFNALQALPARDGRVGFTRFAVGEALLPAGVPVAAGETWSSELYAVRATPFAAAGLEAHADAIAATLGVVPWHRRAPGRHVPNGWNSWSGGSATGGYGTDIDEDTILANLAVMRTELRDWGVDWFQVDDGYEPRFGDWTWNPERFPHGPAWMAERIREAGFRPGLWMAPFTASPDSALVAEHPDWLATPGVLGQALVGERKILDLSHPEVHDWLTERGREVREDWGFEWMKLDFGYLALSGEDLYDPAATRETAWRDAVGAFRDGLGDDTYLLVVGTLGTNYDLAESGRLTLDNFPVWSGQPGVTDPLQQQGLVPTMRTAARRWYLHDRVWENHPDLVFFRGNTEDPSWPALTPGEARAFASFVGVTGGVVDLGDRLVDLRPEEIDVVRRLLPVAGPGARPIDVFTRELPELWVADLEAADGRVVLLGAFHWGENHDHATGEDLPDDVARTFHVDLDALGLGGPWVAMEHWTGTYGGLVDGAITIEVPPHDARVVALHRPTEHPRFIGWNRQIAMGASLLQAVTWADGVLRIVTPVTPGTTFAPFTWEVWLWLPAGFPIPAVEAPGLLSVTKDGPLVRIRFDPPVAEVATITARF